MSDFRIQQIKARLQRRLRDADKAYDLAAPSPFSPDARRATLQRDEAYEAAWRDSDAALLSLKLAARAKPHSKRKLADVVEAAQREVATWPEWKRGGSAAAKKGKKS